MCALIDDAQAIVADARLECSRLGLDRAAMYLAGAAGNMRVATSSVVRSISLSGRGESFDDGVRVLGATGFGLRPTRDRMMGERVRIAVGGAGFLVSEAPCEDEQPCGPVRSLAVDLLSSDELRLLAAGPIFAGLLEAALSRHAWWCSHADARWHPSVAGASAIVDIACGGRWHPRFGAHETGGMVDGQVAELLQRLGWVPMGEVCLPS